MKKKDKDLFGKYSIKQSMEYEFPEIEEYFVYNPKFFLQTTPVR